MSKPTIDEVLAPNLTRSALIPMPVQAVDAKNI